MDMLGKKAANYSPDLSAEIQNTWYFLFMFPNRPIPVGARSQALVESSTTCVQIGGVNAVNFCSNSLLYLLFEFFFLTTVRQPFITVKSSSRVLRKYSQALGYTGELSRAYVTFTAS
jgi:hypothetical protein